MIKWFKKLFKKKKKQPHISAIDVGYLDLLNAIRIELNMKYTQPFVYHPDSDDPTDDFVFVCDVYVPSYFAISRRELEKCKCDPTKLVRLLKIRYVDAIVDIHDLLERKTEE